MAKKTKKKKSSSESTGKTKFKMPADLSKVELKKGGKRIRLKEGAYMARIKEVILTKTQNDDPMIRVTFEFPSTGKSGTLRDNIVLKSSSLWKLKQLYKYAGVKAPKKAATADLTKFIGKEIPIEIEDDEYDGKMVSSIAGYIDPEEFDEESEADDEEEDEDEDDEEDEDEDEDDEEDDEEDEDDLEELDVDDL